MEIIDTVYLIAYLRKNDLLHTESISIIESLSSTRKISEAALIELDLLMKSHNFSYKERLKTWILLASIVSSENIEYMTPYDLAIATILVEKYNIEYFDSLIAAQCIARNADPLTNDRKILYVVSKSKEILNSLETFFR